MQNCFGGLAKFIVVATNLVVFVAGCLSTGYGVHSVFFIRDVGNFQLVVSLKFSPNLTSFVSYGVS